MSRYLHRAAASWIVRSAAVFTVVLLAGYVAVWQSAENGTVHQGRTDAEARDQDSTRSESDGRIETRRDDRSHATDVRIDDLLLEVRPDGGVVLDREALDRTLRDAAGVHGPIDRVRIGDLLDKRPRSRVSFHGMAFEIDRRTAIQLARLFLGDDVSFEDLTVGDLLEALDEAQLSPDRASDALGVPELASLLQSVTGGGESIELTRDSRFGDRQALQQQYAAVDAVVEEVRKEGLAADPGALYEEAFARLVADGMVDTIPLLEARQRLEQDLATAGLREMSPAERAVYRQDARRWAFGAETAELLFDRRESMERYKVDLLAISEDLSLSDEDKAESIRQRRMELKVELAARGSYVGFADEARAEAETQLRVRLGDALDELSAAERDEVVREYQLEQLPPAMREHVESVRNGAAREADAANQGDLRERRQP